MRGARAQGGGPQAARPAAGKRVQQRRVTRAAGEGGSKQVTPLGSVEEAGSAVLRGVGWGTEGGGTAWDLESRFSRMWEQTSLWEAPTQNKNE